MVGFFLCLRIWVLNGEYRARVYCIGFFNGVDGEFGFGVGDVERVFWFMSKG